MLNRRTALEYLATAGSLAAIPRVARAATPAAPAWRPRHTVIVVLENHSYREIIGNPAMPWLNQLAGRSALMTRAYAAPTPYGRVPSGGPVRADDPSSPTTAHWTRGEPFRHPLPSRGSQTNYMYLFAGHNQGLLPDWFLQPGSGRKASELKPAYHDAYGDLLVDVQGRPAPRFTGEIGLSNELLTDYPALRLPFVTPNLGAAVRSKGFSFATFSESLPYPAFNGRGHEPPGVTDGYARRHNPAINWIPFPEYGRPVAPALQRFLLPVGCNLALRPSVDRDGTRHPGFGWDAHGERAPFDALPTVSLVVPNNMNNGHSGSLAAADDWLRAHVAPFADWAAAHDSLLIVTADEDGLTDTTNGAANVGLDAALARHFPGQGRSAMYGLDTLATMFFGPEDRIRPGHYDSRIDHLNVLATVLHLYGALADFTADFKATWGAAQHPLNPKWDGGTHPLRQRELAAQLANLVPVDEIWA